MRVWIDLTNSPHVLVMRPIVERLRAAGHDVEVTARDFAQTLELCRRLQVDHTAIGRHGGERLAAKAAGLASRSAALVRWARAQQRRAGRFEVALGHGSNDVTLAAALLGIPSSTMFDYEWATVQHNINCRLARAVVVPDAIPPARLDRYGAHRKLRRYEGLKEEYYLADFEPAPDVPRSLGLDGSAIGLVLRPPADVALYHRFGNPLFDELLTRIGTRTDLRAVVLPRTPAQADRVRALDLPAVTVPEHAVDGNSLVAGADLVVSAGGTMNREAVVLGTPVYTTFAGRMGGVDERLVAEGRLTPLERVDDLRIEPKPATSAPRVRRDPDRLLDLALVGLNR
jgi:uncharacterized protein